MVHLGVPEIGSCQPPKGSLCDILDFPDIYNSQVFPDNEVRKGQLTMQLKKLRETQETLEWPSNSNDLPVISWESCKNNILA